MQSGGRRGHYDLLVKLMLIGDQAVGKSCLLTRFSENTFSSSFISTIGVDFKVKTLDVDGTRVKLQIWDTAGQERFRTITTAYYRGAMGILLVYDITKEKSFQNVDGWIRNISAHAAPDVVVMLVGNKSDLESKRAVPRAQAEALARENGMEHMETSAKDASNVEEVFQRCTQLVRQRLQQQGRQHPAGSGSRVAGTVPLHHTDTHRGQQHKKEKKGCCG